MMLDGSQRTTALAVGEKPYFMTVQQKTEKMVKEKVLPNLYREEV